MNETPTPQVDKGLDDKKKNAMLRYIGVMFVVAFLFVLISMLGELRTSEATISELNQSSTSAIQKAEQLQDNNRQLEKDNAYLTGRIEELEKQIEDLELELALSEEQMEESRQNLSDALATMDHAQQQTNNVKTAYELLIEAQNAEDPTAILAELEDYLHYFDENARMIYENLTKEGEE